MNVVEERRKGDKGGKDGHAGNSCIKTVLVQQGKDTTTIKIAFTYCSIERERLREKEIGREHEARKLRGG